MWGLTPPPTPPRKRRALHPTLLGRENSLMAKSCARESQTDALAFRGRSPSVTKRATHPSVHGVNSRMLSCGKAAPTGDRS